MRIVGDVMHEYFARTVIADRRDRYVAEAERYQIARRDVSKYRRPSFVLRLVRRMTRARRAAPATAAAITTAAATAAAPKVTAPTI
jgi:hypothetical protein